MKHRTLIAVLALALTACGGRRRNGRIVIDPDPAPSLVSIEVEVYDPITNFVWENVEVRIVEAFTEWSGVTRINADPDDFDYTDIDGIAFFDEFRIADADVGFAEDGAQRAILEAARSLDEAVVTLEIGSPGFASVFVDVELSWGNPDVFVAVPFF